MRTEDSQHLVRSFGTHTHAHTHVPAFDKFGERKRRPASLHHDRPNLEVHHLLAFALLIRRSTTGTRDPHRRRRLRHDLAVWEHPVSNILDRVLVSGHSNGQGVRSPRRHLAYAARTSRIARWTGSIVALTIFSLVSNTRLNQLMPIWASSKVTCDDRQRTRLGPG